MARFSVVSLPPRPKVLILIFSSKSLSIYPAGQNNKRIQARFSWCYGRGPGKRAISTLLYVSTKRTWSPKAGESQGWRLPGNDAGKSDDTQVWSSLTKVQVALVNDGPVSQMRHMFKLYSHRLLQVTLEMSVGPSGEKWSFHAKLDRCFAGSKDVGH